jgi:mannosyltransferase OCH1-like enzyme
LKIPKILYKTSALTKIPPRLSESFFQNEHLLEARIIHYNDNQCSCFIQSNSDHGVFSAYHSLIPGAYKADFWRYCVLFVSGGAYEDLTQTFLKRFDVNHHDSDIILTIDRAVSGRKGLQIAFMAAAPRSGFYEYLIKRITESIERQDKGFSPWDVTGPAACHRYFSEFFNLDQ